MHTQHHMHEKDYQSVTVESKNNFVGYNGLCVMLSTSAKRCVCVCHANYAVQALKDNYNTKGSCGCLL